MSPVTERSDTQSTSSSWADIIMLPAKHEQFALSSADRIFESDREDILVRFAHDYRNSLQINSVGQRGSTTPAYFGAAELHDFELWERHLTGIARRLITADDNNVRQHALTSVEDVLSNRPYARPARWQTAFHPTKSETHFGHALTSNYKYAGLATSYLELADRLIVYTEFSSYDSEIDLDFDGELSFEVALGGGMTLFAALQIDGQLTAGILDSDGRIVKYEERMSEEEYRQLLHNV